MLNARPYTFQEINSDFKVKVEEKPLFPEIPEGFTRSLFEKISNEKPIFDGTLFCVQHITSKLIKAYPLSYKEYIASSSYPQYPHKHKPLAVSGWIVHRDRILLGQRSEKVFQFPGWIELIPSGGIDGRSLLTNKEIHFKRALEIEFEEETGMPAELIEHIQPESLVYCKEQNLYDICMSIHLYSDKWIDCDVSNEEYTQLFWVPLRSLKEFVEGNKKRMIPTSLALIENKVLS